MATFFTNSDGLTQRYGQQTTTDRPYTRVVGSELGGTLVCDFDFNHLDNSGGIGTFWTEDASGGSTPDVPSGINASIPSGSYIKSAHLLISTAFVGATGTLDIGLYEKDGTAIDADGIDVNVAVTAIDAVNDVVVCDGASVGGVVCNVSGATDADTGMYIGVISETADFTAGAARLIVEYVHNR